MFQALKLMLQTLKYKFQSLKHISQSLQQKNSHNYEDFYSIFIKWDLP